MGLYTFIKDEVYLPSDPDTPYKLQVVVDRIDPIACFGGYPWHITYDLMDLQGRICVAGSCRINIPARDINISIFSSVKLFKEVLTRIDELKFNNHKNKLAKEKASKELEAWDGRI